MSEWTWTAHLPVFVILTPLFACLLCPLLCKIRVVLGKRVVICAMLLTLLFAAMQLVTVVRQGQISYWLGGWRPPYGIVLVVDPINGLIVLMVACISFLTALFSSPFTKFTQENWFRVAGYYCMLSFLSVGLLGMSTTGDAFNLYVFMEITAISGYGLIAAGEEKGPIAAFRYLLLGTIGATMYLLGIGFLYGATGTLNMADLRDCIVQLGDSPLLLFSVACLIIGFGVKMALFPLHGWQPAAHAYAHPAADPMIAGVMIKVPAYAMLRFFFCIFRPQSQMMVCFFQIIGVMAVCGILYGSVRALRYDTYNKILAFSSIGQVGYIALGFSIGNVYGLIGAVLHIISHAWMKTGLFYTSGGLKYRYGIHQTTEMGQVYREMPLTGGAMTVFALSMIGLPPLAGFFSKWYLALGAVQNGQYLYVAVLLISSLLSAIYFFRLLEHLFMDKKSAVCKRSGADARRALPWQMLLPIGVTALMVIGIGLANAYLVSGVIGPTIREVFLS